MSIENEAAMRAQAAEQEKLDKVQQQAAKTSDQLKGSTATNKASIAPLS